MCRRTGSDATLIKNADKQITEGCFKLLKFAA